MKTTQVLTNIMAIVTTAKTLNIATYTDQHCSIMGSGLSLENTTETCSTSVYGFSSLEIYASPSDGFVTLYSAANCTGNTSAVDLMQLGCISLGGFVGKSAVLHC